MNLKAALIILMIAASLVPAYFFYQFLYRKIDPRRSGTRFFSWLIAVLAFVFAYTYLVVYILGILLVQRT